MRLSNVPEPGDWQAAWRGEIAGRHLQKVTSRATSFAVDVTRSAGEGDEWADCRSR